MKLQSNNLLENLTTNEIKSLATEIKETICKNLLRNKKRNFTPAEFWDIQRRKRSLLSKRFA